MALPERSLRTLHLFAGAGGGILADLLLGHTPICAVEINSYCQKVLLQRQRDGYLPRFPIWDDVRTFDGKLWAGVTDVVAGGFPCQDISAAGKGAGINGERSGLWSEMARIVREIQPVFVFVENSPMLTLRGIDRVLGDLAEMGYNAQWGVLSAADAIWLGGTPCLDHLRERIWIVATSNTGHRTDSERTRQTRWEAGKRASKHTGEMFPAADNKNGEQERRRDWPRWRSGLTGDDSGSAGGSGGERPHWWQSEPGVGRVAHGVAHRVDRLAAIGNGQVSGVARLAWEILS